MWTSGSGWGFWTASRPDWNLSLRSRECIIMDDRNGEDDDHSSDRRQCWRTPHFWSLVALMASHRSTSYSWTFVLFFSLRLLSNENVIRAWWVLWTLPLSMIWILWNPTPNSLCFADSARHVTVDNEQITHELGKLVLPASSSAISLGFFSPSKWINKVAVLFVLQKKIAAGEKWDRFYARANVTPLVEVRSLI